MKICNIQNTIREKDKLSDPNFNGDRMEVKINLAVLAKREKQLDDRIKELRDLLKLKS